MTEPPWRAALYAPLVLLTMPAVWVRPADGWTSINLLLGPPHAAAGFAAPVPDLAQGLVPWTPLLPFVLARGGPLAAVAMLAVFLEAALSRGPGLLVLGALAASAGGLLADLDRERRPDGLLAVSVLVIGGLVARGHALAAWWFPAAAATVLLASPEWLRIGRRQSGRGLVLLTAGIVGSVLLRAHR